MCPFTNKLNNSITGYSDNKRVTQKETNPTFKWLRGKEESDNDGSSCNHGIVKSKYEILLKNTNWSN
jgi:hypothetical protein